eukprot:4975507-Prymnesium_polylepis.1
MLVVQPHPSSSVARQLVQTRASGSTPRLPGGPTGCSRDHVTPLPAPIKLSPPRGWLMSHTCHISTSHTGCS